MVGLKFCIRFYSWEVIIIVFQKQNESCNWWNLMVTCLSLIVISYEIHFETWLLFINYTPCDTPHICTYFSPCSYAMMAKNFEESYNYFCSFDEYVGGIYIFIRLKFWNHIEICNNILIHSYYACNISRTYNLLIEGKTSYEL